MPVGDRQTKRQEDFGDVLQTGVLVTFLQVLRLLFVSSGCLSWAGVSLESIYIIYLAAK